MSKLITGSYEIPPAPKSEREIIEENGKRAEKLQERINEALTTEPETHTIISPYT